jgi:hypothetical protein
MRRILITLVRSYRYSGSSNSIGSSAWLISPSIEGGKSQGRGDGNKGKTPDRPRSSQGQYTKEKPKVRAAVINEDEEEEQHSEAETSTTAPPSYTKKDVLQYIRGMTIEDRENLYEELSAKADF